MPELQISPLLFALVASTLGSTLSVWHRHGGPRWMFAAGGFFFILGRVSIAAICALMLVATYLASHGMTHEGLPLAVAFGAILLGIGGWSVLAVVRAVVSDAFAPSREDDARIRYTDRHS